MLMAVPAPLLAGVLIDRSSPKRIMLLTNTARVAGFLGFLFVHDLWALIAVALLVAVSDRLFWVAHLALVAELAGSGGRGIAGSVSPRPLRCAGLGAGGLLAGLVVSDLNFGYQTLAIANAFSYALAALLISRLHIPSHGETRWPRLSLGQGARGSLG